MDYAIIGAGRSGRAVARLLAGEDVSIILSDHAAEREEDREEYDALRELGITLEFGGHSDRVLEAKRIVLSPGVPPNIPVLLEAERRGTPITNEIEVAARYCRGRVIGITGTNGKTTTTELLGHCCRLAGRETWVAGNVGTPFSEIVKQVSAEGIVLLELSSFQLEKIERFRPDVALLLNVTPDHMDRYRTVEEYRDAKLRIMEKMTADDLVVYNRDDQWLSSIEVAETIPEIRWFSLSSGEEGRGGASGATVDDGWLAVGQEKILPVDEIGIRGPHNLANSMAAAIALQRIGLSSGEIADGLRSFHALPHRLEEIGRFNGVLWVNDSKGTNTDALKQALGSFRSPIVLIAGGRGKENDYRPLLPLVEEKVRTMVTLGEEEPLLVEAFESSTSILKAGMSLERAVELAESAAEPGDVVLLSPACASFDMFRGFADRGDQFRALVMGRYRTEEMTSEPGEEG